MKKLNPREFGLNDNASSPAESARVDGHFYAGIFSGLKSKNLFMRILAILVIAFFIFLAVISFFPLPSSNKRTPRLIYDVYNYGANTREFHSVTFGGADDKVIYTGTKNDSVTVFDHRDIVIESQNGASTSLHFIDSNGQSIDGEYRGFDGIGWFGASSPVYFADGTMMAGISYSTSSEPFSIEVLNLKTNTLKTYFCGPGCNISGLQNSIGIGIETFSPDGTKLYFSEGNEIGPTKYFYLDLADGSFHDTPSDFPATPSSGDEYAFFPAYNAIFKESLRTGSLDMMDFQSGTTTHLIDDSIYGFIFNGKDVVYTLAPSSSIADEAIVAQGINVQSGEKYPVLPVNLVNTQKHNEITLLDFLPQSSTFLYEIAGDSGWEVRMHNLDNGTDMSVINLTSGQRPDKSQFLEQYVGIIF